MPGLRGLEFYLSEYHAKGEAAFARARPYAVLTFGRLAGGDSHTGLTRTEGVSRDMARLVAEASLDSMRKLGNLSRTTVLELRPKAGEERVTLGRAHENDVIIPQSTVSKFHATFIQLEDGRWSLQDLGSRNGTLLNGHRLRADWPAATLEDGDHLTFGSVPTTFWSSAAFRRLLANLLPG